MSFGGADVSASVFTLSERQCGSGLYPNLCWYSAIYGSSNELVGKQTANFRGSSTARFTLGPNIEIDCNRTAGASTITQSPSLFRGYFTGSLKFVECKLYGPLSPKCKIPAEVKTSELLGEFVSANEIVLSAKVPPFVAFAFENNSPETCPKSIRGNQNITGVDQLEIYFPEFAEAGKTLIGKMSSGLKYGEESASFADEFELYFTEFGDLVDMSDRA
jgi:hypothetical protein